MTTLIITRILVSITTVTVASGQSSYALIEPSGTGPDVTGSDSINATLWNTTDTVGNNTGTPAQQFIHNESVADPPTKASHHELELDAIGSENKMISQNVTSAYVEEPLKRKETIKFLNNITNAVKRAVITQQLRYCPYSDLCMFSFNMTPPKDNVSACTRCSCTNHNFQT